MPRREEARVRVGRGEFSADKLFSIHLFFLIRTYVEHIPEGDPTMFHFRNGEWGPFLSGRSFYPVPRCHQSFRGRKGGREGSLSHISDLVFLSLLAKLVLTLHISSLQSRVFKKAVRKFDPFNFLLDF